MSENLKDIANRVKQEHEAIKPSSKIESKDNLVDEEIIDELDYDEELEDFEIEEEEVDNIEDDDDPVVIGGVSSFSNDDEEDDMDEDESYDFKITDDDLKAEMPDLDDPAFQLASSKIRAEIDTFRKNLIIRSGLTIEEANEAAINRMKKLGKEENDAYLVENPNIGIVEINKKDEDKLEFTEEEREKLSKVKSIKLKIVEDTDLKTIKVERVDKKHRAAILNSLDTNLSQYSVPLPLVGDFCRFKGAQIIQLMNTVKYDDATIDEVISNKATLIYNQLVDGSILKKYDEDGKGVLSYNDFINKFLFHDMDMAMYGILVASSMEEIESTLTCRACEASFQWKYNLKRLLNLDDLSDDFKEKFDDILANKSNTEYLQKQHEKNHKSIRVESPLTKNIYEINHPTIGRAINVFRSIDQKNEQLLYLSAVAIFISNMYVYNKKKDNYVKIEEDEYQDVFKVLTALPQEEIDIILKFVTPYIYTPKFILKTTCPECGNKMSNELDIDQLVFLKARDTSTEIQ